MPGAGEALTRGGLACEVHFLDCERREVYHGQRGARYEGGPRESYRRQFVDQGQF